MGMSSVINKSTGTYTDVNTRDNFACHQTRIEIHLFQTFPKPRPFESLPNCSLPPMGGENGRPSFCRPMSAERRLRRRRFSFCNSMSCLIDVLFGIDSGYWWCLLMSCNDVVLDGRWEEVTLIYRMSCFTLNLFLCQGILWNDIFWVVLDFVEAWNNKFIFIWLGKWWVWI